MKRATVQTRTLPIHFRAFRQRTTTVLQKPIRFIDRQPMVSFFVSIALVLVLIVISNVLIRPKQTTVETKPPVKIVSVYRIGSAPKITVSAQTKKSGVIQITSLAGGIIDKLHVKEGDQVNGGDVLVSLSSNYKGQNSASVQRQIADRQYQTNAATYNTQKDIIKRQKELAEKNEDNAEELRKITSQSLDETRGLISTNEQTLNLINQQISDFNTANPNPNSTTRPTLIALKAQQVQFTASLNQAKQALRTNGYNASGDKPPAEIAEINKEITKKQLEVQEKQLAMSLEVSRLQAQVAAIGESLMFPTAPFAGTIQRVFIKEKQQVSPGTPLVVISQVTQDDPISAVAFVSADVAQKVSRLEPSTIHLGKTITFQAVPSFVSTEAVQGTLYAIYYPIPDEFNEAVVSEGFVTIDIPIGYADTTMIATFIPLDAVYQTREKSYIFIDKYGLAQSKDVQLGQVYGGYVEVLSGLSNGDAVILSRDIIQGDVVKTQ